VLVEGKMYEGGTMKNGRNLSAMGNPSCLQTAGVPMLKNWYLTQGV